METTHTWAVDPGGSMLKLARYLRGYGKECVLSPLFKLLEATFELLVPLVVASIIDVGIATGDQQFILSRGAVLVAMGVVGLVSAITAQYFSARVATGFGTALRDDLFSHVMGLSRADVDRLGRATIVTRMTSDSNLIQDGVNMFFRLVLRSPFIVFGALTMAYVIDGMEGLVFTGVIAVLFAVVFLVMRSTVLRYRGVQDTLDRITLHASENLEGVRVIRAFRRERAEMDAYAADSEELAREQVSVGRISALMNPLTYAIVNLGLVCVLPHRRAGRRRRHPHAGPGRRPRQLHVADPGRAGQARQPHHPALEGLGLREPHRRGVLRHELDARRHRRRGRRPSPRSSSATSASPIQTARPARSGTSRSRPLPGQTIGIIGGTGSGKSTLADLLMRFYDVSTGSVLIGGRDVREYRLDSLRNLVGIVEQGSRLFSGSIADNLRWGNEKATDDELPRGGRAAQATEVVEGKESGLESQVEQLGRNFSGGQRQRLSIARTLVRRPGVLILDDSSSALDFATDAALRRSIHERCRGVTVFLISQRVATIRGADLILVLDDGRLAGSGTHAQLLDDCPPLPGDLPVAALRGRGEVMSRTRIGPQGGGGTTMRRIVRLMRPYRIHLIAALALAVCVVVSTLYVPVLSGRAVDALLGTGRVDFDALSRALVLICVALSVTAGLAMDDERPHQPGRLWRRARPARGRVRQAADPAPLLHRLAWSRGPREQDRHRHRPVLERHPHGLRAVLHRHPHDSNHALLHVLPERPGRARRRVPDAPLRVCGRLHREEDLRAVPRAVRAQGRHDLHRRGDGRRHLDRRGLRHGGQGLCRASRRPTRACARRASRRPSSPRRRIPPRVS
jgi:ABC-type multidrug transport system fused ATPase/permease subunit